MMNKKKTKKLLPKNRLQIMRMAVLALVFGVAGQYLLRYSSAATGPTLFVSPSSATVIQNNSFNIEVRLNSAGQDVDGVEAFLTYPTDKLEFQNISEAGSAFGIGLPSSGGGGNITIRRLVNPDQNQTVNGTNLLVATVSMKAVSASGSAAVNFTAQSRVTAPSAGTGSVLAATIGGTYNLKPPPGPTVPTPSAPSNSTTGSAPTAPAPSASSPSTSTTQRPNSNTSLTTGPDSAAPATVPDQPAQASKPGTSTTPVTVVTKKPAISRLSTSRALVVKVAGGVLLMICAGLLIKLWFTLHRPSFSHSVNAGVINSPVYIGGKNLPKEGPVILTPTQRLSDSPEPASDQHLSDIHPD